MTTTPPLDPMDLFRTFVGQWEKLANDYGTKALARPEAARAMHGATAAGMKAQEVVHDGMAKLLSVANVPTRGDIVDITARLTAIEASLLRLEAALVPTSSSSEVGATKPKRTRVPGRKS